ncbi:hypothetical protein B0H16DRAFT_1464910 [Mycena metata]|uniref:Uncharacterized protein n=1 Tax=Mycena metata TaxID=1033252 RepID=A0AAD7ID25_9AGAR|nr:hypothetical protein B0H16DRAFT_1464910 [Mycena metata]
MQDRSSAGNDSLVDYPVSSRNSSSMGSYQASSASDHPHRTTIPTELQEALIEWAEEGAEQRRTTNHYEEEMVCDPGRQALDILHGSLARFVDYTAMAAEGIKVMQPSSPLTNISISSDSDSGPDPTQTATSLDYSLLTDSPTLVHRSNTEVDVAPAGGVVVVASNIIATGFDIAPMHSEGDDGGSSLRGRRKKFWLTDSRIIKLFRSVRLGFLETICRVEEMMMYCFEVREVRGPFSLPAKRRAYAYFRGYKHSFPAFFTHHPLLHDIEAAKMQVLTHLLQRQGCEGPATLLYEILGVRLRDEYTISHLLNAGFLDANFPEETSHYWELMGNPRLHPHETQESDPESDSDEGNTCLESSVNMDIPPFMYPYLTAERPPIGISDSLIDPVLLHDMLPSPGPLLYPTDKELAERAAHTTGAETVSLAPTFAQHATPISVPLPEFLPLRGQGNIDVNDPAALRAACIRTGIEQCTRPHMDANQGDPEQDAGARSDDDFVVLERNALGLHLN